MTWEAYLFLVLALLALCGCGLWFRAGWGMGYCDGLTDGHMGKTPSFDARWRQARREAARRLFPRP